MRQEGIGLTAVDSFFQQKLLAHPPYSRDCHSPSLSSFSWGLEKGTPEKFVFESMHMRDLQKAYENAYHEKNVYVDFYFSFTKFYFAHLFERERVRNSHWLVHQWLGLTWAVAGS